MITPAARLDSISEYYFAGKLREIAQMQREGKPVLNLGIGSPDLPPHASVIGALQQGADHPKAHGYQSYTGIPALREAWAGWYDRYYGVRLNPENEILPLIGSKEGIVHIAMAFLEAGDIDSLGHERQDQLPGQLLEQIQRLVERVVRLLDAGWRSVRIVTDHGWLFLPEGLPAAELPKHLTLRRWARCAVVSGNSHVSVPRVAWHWNPSESAAVAPGIACFNGSLCYAHGGLSIQECLTPDLVVTRGGERRLRASIKSLTWRGMRCLIEADVEGGEVRADLRLENANGASVVKAPKALEADGSTSLIVADDRHETASLVLVLLAPDHSVIAQQETKVGEST